MADKVLYMSKVLIRFTKYLEQTLKTNVKAQKEAVQQLQECTCLNGRHFLKVCPDLGEVHDLLDSFNVPVEDLVQTERRNEAREQILVFIQNLLFEMTRRQTPQVDVACLHRLSPSRVRHVIRKIVLKTYKASLFEQKQEVMNEAVLAMSEDEMHSMHWHDEASIERLLDRRNRPTLIVRTTTRELWTTCVLDDERAGYKKNCVDTAQDILFHTFLTSLIGAVCTFLRYFQEYLFCMEMDPLTWEADMTEAQFQLGKSTLLDILSKDLSGGRIWDYLGWRPSNEVQDD